MPGTPDRTGSCLRRWPAAAGPHHGLRSRIPGSFGSRSAAGRRAQVLGAQVLGGAGLGVPSASRCSSSAGQERDPRRSHGRRLRTPGHESPGDRRVGAGSSRLVILVQFGMYSIRARSAREVAARIDVAGIADFGGAMAALPPGRPARTKPRKNGRLEKGGSDPMPSGKSQVPGVTRRGQRLESPGTAPLREETLAQAARCRTVPRPASLPRHDPPVCAPPAPHTPPASRTPPLTKLFQERGSTQKIPGIRCETG